MLQEKKLKKKKKSKLLSSFLRDLKYFPRVFKIKNILKGFKFVYAMELI